MSRAAATWDDAQYTWDDAVATWDDLAAADVPRRRIVAGANLGRRLSVTRGRQITIPAGRSIAHAD